MRRRWEEIEDLGDLERLRLVLEYMPDEGLMRILELNRGKGRNRYPIRAVWNTILAGVVAEPDGRPDLDATHELPVAYKVTKASESEVKFGFDNHYIRGQRKMQARVGLALCVMLAMAVGWIQENKLGNIRSLVKAS